jgi:NAD(P)-dependent dehydrogenase (short-subunit alcohol dehydrogenase family)
MRWELDGETALVTGAASGLGRAIAGLLGEAGARLCLVDLNEAGAKQALDEIAVPGAVFAADLSDPDQVEDLLVAVDDGFGSVDILINNAGIPGVGEPKALHETTTAEWQQVLAINLTAPFLLARGLIPAMVQRGGGVIVNIASVAGLGAFPGRSPYIASKAGVVNLTRSIAVEYGRRGVRANAVCPGAIDTPMTHWRWEQPDLLAAAVSRIPAGRVADPPDIAEAALFLASKAARYLNGAAIPVDGGWTAGL